MFGIFKKKSNLTRLNDQVWWDNAKRESAVFHYLQENTSHQKVVTIVCFFNETFTKIIHYCQQNNLSYTSIEMFTGIVDFTAEHSQIFIFKAEPIIKNNIVEGLIKAKNITELNVVFPEHYPLKSTESDVIHKFEESGLKTTLQFFVSLDEPFFSIFGGERVKELLHKIGMDSNESLQHTMIDKSIAGCQEKIEKEIAFENRAQSAEEWFRLNRVF